MLFRKLGKILRGKATPFQLFMACILGSLLGFMPGFAQAPGLILVVTLLLIVLNANLAVAALVGALAKLLSLLLMPLTFAVGGWLLDGPAQSLFANLINAPVFALFGFEYYVTTGGLLMGLIFGCVTGYALARTITSYRKTMVKLGTDPGKFQKFVSKKPVKAVTWLLLGSSPGKEGYEKILSKKVGQPIRMLGVVFAALVCVLLVLLQMFAAGPIVTYVLQSGLETANGATVDLGSADLNLKENRLTITQLALADPNQLDTDLFRAEKLEADVNATDLLRKRLKLDRVVVTAASHGESRRTPGKIIGEPPTPTPEPPDSPPDLKSLDDYLKDAKVWKERLAQVRRWMEKLSGPESEEGETGAPGEKVETLRERLEREVRQLGYKQVRARHLIEGSPTFTVMELTVDKMTVADLKDETLAVLGKNLSTHPSLLGETPELRIESSAGTFRFGASMGSYATAPTPNTMTLAYQGLPTDTVAKGLSIQQENPIRGGTIDLSADGSWTTVGGVTIDLPVQAVLHNVTLSLPNVGETTIEEMVVPIQLSGPIDNPRVTVDDRLLGDALLKAGVSKAKDEITNRAQEKLTEELGGQVGETGGNLLKGILGGKKK